MRWGTWFTKSARGENGSKSGTPVRLDPISQINGYTRHTWANLAQTTVWAGAANLVTPAATGTVDAFLGVSFFPGRSAFRSVRNTYAPMIGVANNPTFAVDLAR